VVLQKYTFYRERFDAFVHLGARVSKMVFEIETSETVTAERSKFLHDALQQLKKGLHLLQWTFCLCYFLKESAEKKLFVYQQVRSATVAV
jgi:hypothetical protein